MQTAKRRNRRFYSPSPNNTRSWRRALRFISICVLPALAPVTAFSSTPPRGYEAISGTLEGSKLNGLLDQYLATVQTFDPEAATAMGLHGADTVLTSRDFETLNSKLEALRKLRARLAEVQKAELSPDLLMDYDVLERTLDVEIFNIGKLDVLRMRPQYYLPMDAVYGLLNKEFSAYGNRASAALDRLEQLPKVLLQAEKNLGRPPRIWVEQSIEQIEGVLATFQEVLPMFRGFTRYDPVVKERVDQAVAGARKALRRYEDFLKTYVLPHADGDFAVGEKAYRFYLERRHGLDRSPGSVYRYVKKSFRKTLEEIRKEARACDPEAGKGDDGWKAMMDKAVAEHPAREELLKVFRQELERAYDHFDKFKVVPFPQERLRIRETPAFMASVLPFASYNPPFPLDEARVAEFYVTLPSPQLSPAVQEKILQINFNYPQIELIVAHEAMPGLHLQNYESGGASRIRKIASSPFVTNGWGSYSELLAQEMGFYTSPWSKLVYLRWKLIRAARAVIDVQLHRGRMTYDEALEFLQSEAGLSAAQARSEILKVSLQPTEGISYIMGMDRIMQMRGYYEKKEKRYFNLREFHSSFLRIGNLPLNLIEAELRRKQKEDEDARGAYP